MIDSPKQWQQWVSIIERGVWQDMRNKQMGLIIQKYCLPDWKAKYYIYILNRLTLTHMLVHKSFGKPHQIRFSA